MRSMAAGLLALVAGSFSAQGQMADLTKASCRQLMDLPRNDRGQLIVWLHGYFAGAAQRAMLDRTKLDDAVAAIQQACERNRDMPLIGIEARAIFLGEPLPQAQPQPSPAPSSEPATNPAAETNRAFPVPR